MGRLIPIIHTVFIEAQNYPKTSILMQAPKDRAKIYEKNPEKPCPPCLCGIPR